MEFVIVYINPLMTQKHLDTRIYISSPWAHRSAG